MLFILLFWTIFAQKWMQLPLIEDLYKSSEEQSSFPKEQYYSDINYYDSSKSNEDSVDDNELSYLTGNENQLSNSRDRRRQVKNKNKILYCTTYLCYSTEYHSLFCHLNARCAKIYIKILDKEQMNVLTQRKKFLSFSWIWFNSWISVPYKLIAITPIFLNFINYQHFNFWRTESWRFDVSNLENKFIQKLVGSKYR